MKTESFTEEFIKKFIKLVLEDATDEGTVSATLCKKCMQAYADQQVNIAYKNGYATAIADEAKLDKERRNKVIDEVIECLSKGVEFGYFEAYWKNIKKELESLKIKQP